MMSTSDAGSLLMEWYALSVREAPSEQAMAVQQHDWSYNSTLVQ